MRLMINERLANSKGISEEDKDLISDLNVKLYDMIKKPFDFAGTPEEAVKEVEKIEFELQRLWGFNQDPMMHRHWHKLNGCACGSLDNTESLGHRRIINGDCPYHGTDVAESWDDSRFNFN